MERKTKGNLKKFSLYTVSQYRLDLKNNSDKVLLGKLDLMFTERNKTDRHKFVLIS